MAMGVPSIAFAIPAVLEIDAGTGSILTVPPMDTLRFAEAILHLASAPDERRQIGEKGRAQVLQRFLVQKNMAKAVQGLAQAVEKRRKSYGLNAHVSS
jgi:glycosyltransferase involved in cell wall biosynthesis